MEKAVTALEARMALEAFEAKQKCIAIRKVRAHPGRAIHVRIVIDENFGFF